MIYYYRNTITYFPINNIEIQSPSDEPKSNLIITWSENGIYLLVVSTIPEKTEGSSEENDSDLSRNMYCDLTCLFIHPLSISY
jgi:hypothetical protein